MSVRAVLLLSVLTLAGCGSAAASRPDPTPVTPGHVAGYRPTPPQLPAGHAPGALYVVDLTNIGKATPATLAFASNASLLHLRWSGWGGASAVGQGNLLLKSCRPDCATSPVIAYAGTVRLSGLKACDHARFYVDSSVVAATRRGPWHLASFMRDPCAPHP